MSAQHVQTILGVAGLLGMALLLQPGCVVGDGCNPAAKINDKEASAEEMPDGDYASVGGIYRTKPTLGPDYPSIPEPPPVPEGASKRYFCTVDYLAYGDIGYQGKFGFFVHQSTYNILAPTVAVAKYSVWIQALVDCQATILINKGLATSGVVSPSGTPIDPSNMPFCFDINHVADPSDSKMAFAGDHVYPLKITCFAPPILEECR